jgi:hypothetical protein
VRAYRGQEEAEWEQRGVLELHQVERPPTV